MKVAVLCLEAGALAEVYPEDYKGREESSKMHASVEALKKLGHEVTLVNMDQDAFEKLRGMKVDVAFNLCDDGYRNEAWMEPHVVAMLDILRIRYTGSGFKTLTLCLDKAHTKKILSYHDLPTPAFYVAETEDDVDHDLKYPLIVKPSREDGSIGIRYDAVVEDAAGLRERIARVVETYRQPALVEEYIAGREFNVAIIGNDNPKALPVSEIRFDGLPPNQRIVSYKAKWEKESPQYKATVPECPAKINHELSEDLKEIAKEAYRRMEVRGYGRVDFRVNGAGPKILEVNPNPDISIDAGLPRSARAAGFTYEQLIEKILDYAMEDAL